MDSDLRLCSSHLAEVIREIDACNGAFCALIQSQCKDGAVLEMPLEWLQRARDRLNDAITVLAMAREDNKGK